MEEQLINRLESNLSVINALLNNRERDEYYFKPSEDAWSIIQVLSHLVDEEVLDFRLRLFSLLDKPEEVFPAYDPVSLIKKRSFVDDDFNQMLDTFMDERIKSVAMLRSLNDPPWDNSYNNRNLGEISARDFLANWVAHDYIHIQQINRLTYQFLNHKTKIDLTYAGNFRM